MGEVTYTQKLIALLSLWAVSTCIGFTFKISQVKGRYNYNPASAVVMTELFKLVSSIVVAATVVMREMRDVPAPSSITVTSFWESYKTFYASSLSRELVGHTLGLAVSYAVVNNVSFAIFIHAPASSFFLLKAASPVITAVMLRVMVSRQISVVQWVSIIMQMGALVLTQYNGCTRSSELTFLAYFLIIVNVAVSCAAGVWNEHIVKTCGGSVNVLNTVLYCWGILVNLILYVLLPPSWIGGGATLGFFDGYSWAVWGVICANGVLGLVITAVYKYADVVIKTFGLAASTASMYVLEYMGVLPGNTATRNSLVGAVLVFYASYVYIAPVPAPAPEEKQQSLPEQLEEGKESTKSNKNNVISANKLPPVVSERITIMLGMALAAGMFVFAAPVPCSS